MANSPMDDVAKLTAWLADLYGTRLQSLVLYGSHANGLAPGQVSAHSRVNLLAVLDQVDAAALDLGEPALAWWQKQKHPPIQMLSRDEVNDSADVFPIEYLDIQAHHRVLHGLDLFTATPRFPELHRLQVEHDLRSKVLRLRSAYVRSQRDAKALEAVMLESVSTFLTLFRHALAALGQPLVINKDEVLAAASARFGFDPAPFTAILQARRLPAKLAERKLDRLRTLFAQYLAAITLVERTLEVQPTHA